MRLRSPSCHELECIGDVDDFLLEEITTFAEEEAICVTLHPSFARYIDRSVQETHFRIVTVNSKWQPGCFVFVNSCSYFL